MSSVGNLTSPLNLPATLLGPVWPVTAKSAGVPFILIENGYTEKKSSEIHHNHLVKDFIGIEVIISKYLNH